jgi:hypothetical protein
MSSNDKMILRSETKKGLNKEKIKDDEFNNQEILISESINVDNNNNNVFNKDNDILENILNISKNLINDSSLNNNNNNNFNNDFNNFNNDSKVLEKTHSKDNILKHL